MLYKYVSYKDIHCLVDGKPIWLRIYCLVILEAFINSSFLREWQLVVCNIFVSSKGMIDIGKQRDASPLKQSFDGGGGGRGGGRERG